MASCTPGITISAATGANDNCGYPVSGFNANPSMCGINIVNYYTSSFDLDAIQIQAYFNAEHAMTLGCATPTISVSPLTSDPGYATYPQTGDPSCSDAAG